MDLAARYKRRVPRICECGEHGFVPCTMGRVTMFDPHDIVIVAQWNWTTLNKYPSRRTAKAEGNKTIFLHHALIGDLPGMQVDHRDGDGMNNRRGNLRHVSKAQNQMNRHAVVARSGYKGVVRNKRRWGAGLTIREGGKRVAHWFGTFDTPEEAARAYDVGARRIFGEFARTNFSAME